MHKLLAIPALCAATAVFAQAPASQPTPAIASSAWSLNFKFQDPQRLSVLLPGEAVPTVYWYMLYTVENTTDREIDFHPGFEVVTDKLEVIKADRGVSPEAYQAVFRRAKDPTLLPPEKIAGRILRGQDRARHGVAIWKDVNAQTKSFTVYVSGLSGEIARWKNPAVDPNKPEGPDNQRYFLLRKTLAVPYNLAGSEESRAAAVPQRIADKQRWVMR